MAKVDVFIPCYNYARFLEECVRSVLTQSVKDVRVLIIDDASSDDSLSVAKKLAQADSRVSVVGHGANRGHIETYNEGIAWASAEYCLLLSADDLLVPGALERAVEVMDANPDVVLTYGKAIVWQDDLPISDIKPIQRYTWERYDLLKHLCLTSENFATCTAIARTKTQKTVGVYRASLPHCCDMEMWLRFTANGTIARINAIQGIYRKHSAAMSNRYYIDRMQDFLQSKSAFDSFFDEYENSLNNLRSWRSVARRALASRMFGYGIRLVVRRRLHDGWRMIRASFDMDPRLRYRPPALWLLIKMVRKVKAKLERSTF